MNDSQVNVLVAAYEAGKSMKDLAAEFGINRVTVSIHLRRAEDLLRRTGLDPEQTAEAASLYRTGWS